MVAFPVAKLGALFLKQISKPLANVVKARAKTSPFFRTYICMPPAQFYHWAEVKLKMWSMNLGKPVNIPKLNENMAIDLGAELVGEGIIFSIAAAIVVFEYVRSYRKEALKEEERKEELIRIQEELRELYFAKAKQEAQFHELLQALHLNLPSLKFSSSQNYDPSLIPLHHREGKGEEEPSESILSRMNNVLWAAVDFIIPGVEDSTRPQTIKLVVKEEEGGVKNSSNETKEAKEESVKIISPSLPSSPSTNAKT